MALSVDGLVSGLDTTSIISQLMDLERRPIDLLEVKQEKLSAQNQAWNEVRTRLLAFESAANKLNTSSLFSSYGASFRNDNPSGGSVLSVTAGTSAAAGGYNINVTQLATAEKSVSNEGFTDTTSAAGASGVITIDGATNIAVAATDSLSDIQSNINASGASVTATVLNTGTGASPSYKLVLTGSDTGSANAFTVTDITNLTFSESQAAQDAQFTMDGIGFTKSSNTVVDVIDDVTISLETTGSGMISIEGDYDAILEKVREFVDAYNGLMDYINEQFEYNPELNEKGDLFGNGALLTIQSQLRSIVTGAVPGIDATNQANIAFLSQAGISTDGDNHLVIDESAFLDKLKDRFDDVMNLFVSSGSGTYTFVAASGETVGGTYNTQVVGGVLQIQNSAGAWIDTTQSGAFAYGQNDTDFAGLLLRTGALTNGDTGTITIATGIAELVSAYTATYTEHSADGLVFNENYNIERQDKEIQEQIDTLEERIAKKEKDLRGKFATLETLLSKLTSEQQYLEQQLSTLSSGWAFGIGK